MNMIKTDNLIMCSHFVMLMTKSENEPFFIQGPVVIVLKDGSFNDVISYIM